MNESFRKDFAQLQTFKFFAQDTMTDIENIQQRYEDELKEVRKEMLEQSERISQFETVNAEHIGKIVEVDERIGKTEAKLKKEFYEALAIVEKQNKRLYKLE